MKRSSKTAARVLVLGGGGHARVVIDALVASGAAAPYGVLDADRSRWGATLLDVPIRGGDDLLPKLAAGGKTRFVMGLGGAGDNRPRARLFEAARLKGLKPLTVAHPTAVCSDWAKVGAGSVLLANSAVNAGAVLGEDVIVNTGAVVEHDCVLGDHVHVATGARMASGVRISALAHIGAGATVRQGISIGEGAVVGAGAVVVKDVPAWTVVVGVPARTLRKVER